jgi:hypothetical protein
MSSARRLLNAVAKAVPSEEGKKMLLEHFAKTSSATQDAYAELLEDVMVYRTILTEHKIGEFQVSQKEKVKRTAGLVGLQVPKLYGEPQVVVDKD